MNIFDISALFSQQGQLAEHIPGFTTRTSQQTMAAAVATALQDASILVVEAATGTGKTFAYLVPALLSEQKVIISTGTKNLQDQLYHRDLPQIRTALQAHRKTALLKGRANYLCLHRLDQHLTDTAFLSKSIVSLLSKALKWSRKTKTGDIAEQAYLTDDNPVLPLITSTPDNCLNQDCPRINDCFLIKARRKAQESEILIVNHHLFFSDLALKDQGFGELLPGADAVIFDEAHQIHEIATQFFGTVISSRMLTNLASDTDNARTTEASDMLELPERTAALLSAVDTLRAVLGGNNNRGVWLEKMRDPSVQQGVTEIQTALQILSEALAVAAPRGKNLENCWERSVELLAKWTHLTQNTPEDHVHWYETFTRAFSIHVTPLSIAAAFSGYVRSKSRAFIFTSATLAVDNQFNHFTDNLGITPDASLILPSPFDYANQSLLYAPRGLPDPSAPHYTQAVAAVALATIMASAGRAFLLFTSHKALQETAAYLKNKTDYPLLVQGTLGKRELLDQFRALGNAVLLGTYSFWEGVDVRGEALSCVLIDRLPFASPTDPVMQAKIAALKKRGQDPFLHYQLPAAIIALKQGAGRLIRDERDEGVLVIADPRFTGREYGRLFLASLPPMSRTRDIETVRQFFEAKTPLTSILPQIDCP